jgi:8-oxo-dGTP pyrophosphatase MutT (NUDIX family)
MLTFHAAGDWNRRQVHAAWTESTRPIIPEVERLIDAAWNAALATPGVNLFDGPMCRLESWEASPTALRLVLSPTSYRPFLGTNLKHPHLADDYRAHGRGILANPVGVSPALATADGWLMFGRRNASVAYYPNCVHPFAGALEPRDSMDIFAAVARELNEELGFTAADIAPDGIRCTGIAEDHRIRQPELILRVRSTRTRGQVDATLDDCEHHASWVVPAERNAVEEVLRAQRGAGAPSPSLTPVTIAALLLWGRTEFGVDWFEAWSAPMRG